MNHSPSLPCGPSVHGFLDLPAIKASHIHLYVEECLRLVLVQFICKCNAKSPEWKREFRLYKMAFVN